MFQEIGKFIKDWIPSIGVIIAGLWVLYKWLKSEKLREIKERASLEGTLSCNHINISEKNCLVMFTATWKNISPLPISVDTEKTTLNIYKVDSDLQPGGIDFRLNKDILGAPVVELRLFEKLRSLILEPNSQADFQSMAVLTEGNVYLARFKLYRKTKKGLFSRSRICFFDLRSQHNQTNAADS